MVDDSSDVPEADAIEQAEEVDPATDTAATVRSIPSEASEADALEQAEEVPDDPDDRA